MSTERYIQHIRDARKRPSVLKAKILTIRSGEAEIPILVFEGKTDVGPYDTWIRRVYDSFRYKGIPAEGKAQLLDFRESIKDVDDSQYESIYFFIDYDFDGMRGYDVSDNIFCIDSYSFENYLVSEVVLESLLNDEFECAAELETIKAVKELFLKVSGEFCIAMNEANSRLHQAAEYSLERGRLEPKINKFVDVKLDKVIKKHSSNDLEALVPLLKEITEEEAEIAMRKFGEIENPMHSHRGKYILNFFLSWLDLLAKARRDGELPFEGGAKIKFNRGALSERSLATRSLLPRGLDDFINKINEQVAA